MSNSESYCDQLGEKDATIARLREEVNNLGRFQEQVRDIIISDALTLSTSMTATLEHHK